jgi:hypothetical protein
VPEEYVCSECKASGVKLWRRYQTVASLVHLRCCRCACKIQKISLAEFVDSFGRFIQGDQIGWMVPAVPTEDGETYWGYTSVPEAGVGWWKCLPLERKP